MILDVWGYYRTHFEWNQKLMKITVEIASSVIYLFFLAPRSVLLFPHMFLLYWCHHLKCNFTINLISRHAVWERKRKQITFTSLDRSYASATAFSDSLWRHHFYARMATCHLLSLQTPAHVTCDMHNHKQDERQPENKNMSQEINGTEVQIW